MNIKRKNIKTKNKSKFDFNTYSKNKYLYNKITKKLVPREADHYKVPKHSKKFFSCVWF